MQKVKQKSTGSGGIRTHAIEMTGALNQRLRPLGHTTKLTKFFHTAQRPTSQGLATKAKSNVCNICTAVV